MNKASAFGILGSLIACAGVAFAAVQLRGLAESLEGIDRRLAKVEQATAMPTPAAEGEGRKAGGGPATMSEVAQEVVKLREELAQVRVAQDSMAAAVAKPEKGKDVVAHVSNDEVKKAVEETLAEKAKEEKEKNAKRTQEFAARAAAGMVDYMTKELGLTEQQKAQVAEIVSAQMAVFQKIWTERAEGDDIRAKMDEARKDTDTKIKAVLTTEQQVKYDEVSKQGPGAWGGGRNLGIGQGGR